MLPQTPPPAILIICALVDEVNSFVPTLTVAARPTSGPSQRHLRVESRHSAERGAQDIPGVEGKDEPQMFVLFRSGSAPFGQIERTGCRALPSLETMARTDRSSDLRRAASLEVARRFYETLTSGRSIKATRVPSTPRGQLGRRMV